MFNTQTYSYHTHTNFSDGHCSVAEMIKRAKQIGYTQMGISDHLIVHKNMRRNQSWQYLREKDSIHVYNNSFSDILERFKRHCAEIRRLAKVENFKVYIGFEVDYFPYNGWEEELKWFLSQLDYDYLHTGNHFFCEENCENIINMAFFKQICTDTERYKEYVQRHFAIMRQAVESGLFKFLAHLDYVRRYGNDICGADDYLPEKMLVLDALQKNNTAMEISTKGLRKIGDFYPSATVLQEAAKRNLTVVISDDAHKTEELGMDFTKAEDIIKKYGFSKRLKF
ncbi:MAG: PHP domain-containing protein [Alphaproteobacteria bacterium]|nr:PHP domain-containing protein [Alphaproteobacteria bacterium]